MHKAKELLKKALVAFDLLPTSVKIIFYSAISALCAQLSADLLRIAKDASPYVVIVVTVLANLVLYIGKESAQETLVSKN